MSEQVKVTSPGDDIFANGQSQTVVGVVSPTTWVGTDAVAVARFCSLTGKPRLRLTSA